MRTALFWVITQRPRRARSQLLRGGSLKSRIFSIFIVVLYSFLFLGIYCSHLSEHVCTLLFPHVPYSVFTISVMKRLVQIMKLLFLYFSISFPVAWLYPKGSEVIFSCGIRPLYCLKQSIYNHKIKHQQILLSNPVLLM